MTSVHVPAYRDAHGRRVAIGRTTLRQFAPSDVTSLVSVPEIEQKYRLIRNEWLTCASRLKQAQERELQAGRQNDMDALEEARKDIGKISAELGVWRRLSIICQQRAEAMVFKEIAHKVLPVEIRKALDEMTEETLRRPYGDTPRPVTAATPKAEDYALLDEMLRRWGDQ